MPGEAMNGGTKHDAQKLRMDLLPPEAEIALATVLTYGADKYNADNWRKGLSFSRVLAAAQRHLNAYRRGEYSDEESGLPHLWHALCNLAFLVTFDMNKEYEGNNDLYAYRKEE